MESEFTIDHERTNAKHRVTSFTHQEGENKGSQSFSSRHEFGAIPYAGELGRARNRGLNQLVPFG